MYSQTIQPNNSVWAFNFDWLFFSCSRSRSSLNQQLLLDLLDDQMNRPSFWKKWRMLLGKNDKQNKTVCSFWKNKKREKATKKKVFCGKFRFLSQISKLKNEPNTVSCKFFFFVTTAIELFNPGLAMFHVATMDGTNSKKEKNNVCYCFVTAILKVDTQKGKLIFVPVPKKQLWYRYLFFDTFAVQSDISTVTKKESDTVILEDDTLNGFLNRTVVSFW